MFLQGLVLHKYFMDTVSPGAVYSTSTLWTLSLQGLVLHKYFMDTVSPGLCTPQILYWHFSSGTAYSTNTLWTLFLQGLSTPQVLYGHCFYRTVLPKYFMDSFSKTVHSTCTLWTLFLQGLCTPQVLHGHFLSKTVYSTITYGHCFSGNCVHPYVLYGFLDCLSWDLVSTSILRTLSRDCTLHDFKYFYRNWYSPITVLIKKPRNFTSLLFDIDS